MDDKKISELTDEELLEELKKAQKQFEETGWYVTLAKLSYELHKRKTKGGGCYL